MTRTSSLSAALNNIPPAWIDRSAPGARCLTLLTGGLGAGHPVLLHHTGTDTPADTDTTVLDGRFLPWTWPLTRTRHQARPAALRRRTAPAATDMPRTCHTAVDPAGLHTDTPIALLHQLALPPGTTAAVRDGATNRPATYLHSPDGSWAEIVHDTDRHGLHAARTAGPTDLIAALDTAHTHYNDLHRPGWATFGITATTYATLVWHASPDGPSWPMRPALPDRTTS